LGAGKTPAEPQLKAMTRTQGGGPKAQKKKNCTLKKGLRSKGKNGGARSYKAGVKPSTAERRTIKMFEVNPGLAEGRFEGINLGKKKKRSVGERGKRGLKTGLAHMGGAKKNRVAEGVLGTTGEETGSLKGNKPEEKGIGTPPPKGGQETRPGVGFTGERAEIKTAKKLHRLVETRGSYNCWFKGRSA